MRFLIDTIHAAPALIGGFTFAVVCYVPVAYFVEGLASGHICPECWRRIDRGNHTRCKGPTIPEL